ncbi:MAG: hypothetical protein ACJAYU_004926 [Bradymonadia bacterium]|jgi:hypothetical protein
MATTKLRAAVLSFNGLAFLGFGLAFLLWPSAMTADLDITLPTARADIEIRAFYGGLELGFGAFLLLAARRHSWQVPALVGAAMLLGGAGTTRVVGQLLEGQLVQPHAWLAALELSGAALSAVVARRSAD